jgi:hypothetical protein
MHRSRTALALLLTLAFAAAGCGSDDDDSKSGASSAGDKTEQADKTDKKTEKSSAPKKTSARGKLVSCIEGEGLEISHEGDDAEKATNYTVGPDNAKRRKAVIKIHSNRGEASRSAERAGLDKGLNAVAFGRAEFIRYEATDNEAGRIVNCMSAAYGG